MVCFLCPNAPLCGYLGAYRNCTLSKKSCNSFEHPYYARFVNGLMFVQIGEVITQNKRDKQSRLFCVVFYIFVVSFGVIRRTIHIDESVFVSLQRNLTVSITTGQTNSTHSCLDYAVRGFCTLRYLISIRVWGIASFIVVRVLSEPLCRQTEQPHTFFCINPSFLRLVTQQTIVYGRF